MSDSNDPGGTLPPDDGDDGDGRDLTHGAIEPIEIQEEMERSFLDYAMSVIMARALPDVRDGLKPVHRRIIWDMEQQGFRPDRPFVKCARVTGDTMAKYHPHGGPAIYDALVRMAQPFSLRHPLIDFHGNYGSPDFGPAAERYTECRLHALAMQMVADIDENTVDLVPTYDASNEEPVVLPARFPNLLVNGSQGIAVGMATNIPPHNLGEVIDATVHLIDHPDATPDDLMQFVHGPDFPTGGFIMGRAGIMEAYRTGRGSVKMRARATIEESSRRGAPMEIVVTQLPYQASCKAIAGRIQELVDAGDLEGIADVNDNSAGGKTSLVITLRRDANPNVVLNNLFKQTQLQTSFAVNMVALVDGVPRTLNLVQALQGYIAHQVEVITRRSQYRLDKARRDEEIQEGLLRALNVIDEVIALIRASEDRAAARSGLIEQFGFTELQAEHILEMRLGQLTRLSRIDIEQKLEKLRELIAELEAILADDGRLKAVIKQDLLAIKEQFATPRAAEVVLDDGDMSVEDLVEDKELVVVMTEAGYVKTVDADAFKTQGRGGRGVAGAKLKADDLVSHVIFTTAHAHLLFFSNRGKVYRLRAMDIPERERTAKGIPIVNLLPLVAGETIRAIIDTRTFAGERFLFFATRRGPGEAHGVHRVRLVPARRPHRPQPARRGRAGPRHRDDDRRRHLHGQPLGPDHPLQRGRGAAHGPGRGRGAGHEAEGGGLRRLRRCGPRRRRHPHGDRGRLRQAHATRALQPAGPRRPRRHRHQADEPQGSRGRGVHGRPGGRDRRRVVGRRRHPHLGPGDLLAGPHGHWRPHHEPGRRPIRGLGSAHPGRQRRQLTFA